MQIDLPPELAERLHRFTTVGEGCTEVDVIRRALDSLEWQEQERQAIQEGVDARKAGRVRDFDEFDREFRARHGISDTE